MKHLSSRVVLDLPFSSSNLVHHKKVPDVDMSCSLTAQGLPILHDQYGALVVMVDNQILNSVSLCLKKLASP
jgi:hypothetical protein